MARVPYVESTGPAGNPALAGLYAEIGGLRGSVLNLYRALGNQPAALRAFMTMSRYIRDDADLPAALRELAILAVGYALNAPYEQYHHRPAARAAGVPDEQLAAFPDWREATCWTAIEHAVLTYADEVAREHDCSASTFAAVEQALPRPQLIDLVLTVGWYHLCAAVLGPLRIETEDRAMGASGAPGSGAGASHAAPPA